MLEYYDISVNWVPSSPSNVQAIGGSGNAIVSFLAPSFNGGDQHSIQYYFIISLPDFINVAVTSSPVVISGLHNGMSYYFNELSILLVGSCSSNLLDSSTNVTAVRGNQNVL